MDRWRFIYYVALNNSSRAYLGFKNCRADFNELIFGSKRVKGLQEVYPERV